MRSFLSESKKPKFFIFAGFSVIVLLFLFIRLIGTCKDRFWLDEVCSYYISYGSITDVAQACAKDAHPPFYYISLNAWRRVFGASETSIRGLSVFWSMIGAVAMVLFCREISSNWHAPFVVGLLVAINPLDVYFAHEARMYSQTTAFCTFSTWFLWRWFTLTSENSSKVHRGKHPWIWGFLYAIAAALVLYTHYIGALVLIAQGVFALFWFAKQRKLKSIVGYLICAGACAVFLFPWLRYVLKGRGSLYDAAHLGWIPKPTFSEIYLFAVREFFWSFSGLSGKSLLFAQSASIVVLLILFSTMIILISRNNTPSNSPNKKSSFGYLFWLTTVPVLLAILVSCCTHPLYYRPRFSIFVLPPFLIMVALLVDTMKSIPLKTITSIIVAFLMTFGVWLQYQHLDYQGMKAFPQAWIDLGPADYAFFFPAHHRITTSYYVGKWISKPPRSRFVSMLRQDASEKKIWVCSDVNGRFNKYTDEQLYHDWLLTLGSVKELGAFDGLLVTEVSVSPSDWAYPLYRIGSKIEFGNEGSDTYLPSGWYHRESGFRWSKGSKASIVFELKNSGVKKVLMSMFCFQRQRITVELNKHEIARFVCSRRSPHQREIDIPQGVAHKRNTLVFHLPDTISPSEVSESGDRRKLALGIEWMTIE